MFQFRQVNCRKKIRRVRLAVRTWPSQGRNTGSIPVRATTPSRDTKQLVTLVIVEKIEKLKKEVKIK